eukprot:1641123-Rhodomonas_salina.3
MVLRTPSTDVAYGAARTETETASYTARASKSRVLEALRLNLVAKRKDASGNADTFARVEIRRHQQYCRHCSS